MLSEALTNIPMSSYFYLIGKETEMDINYWESHNYTVTKLEFKFSFPDTQFSDFTVRWKIFYEVDEFGTRISYL